MFLLNDVVMAKNMDQHLSTHISNIHENVTKNNTLDNWSILSVNLVIGDYSYTAIDSIVKHDSVHGDFKFYRLTVKDNMDMIKTIDCHEDISLFVKGGNYVKINQLNYSHLIYDNEDRLNQFIKCVPINVPLNKKCYEIECRHTPGIFYGGFIVK